MVLMNVRQSAAISVVLILVAGAFAGAAGKLGKEEGAIKKNANIDKNGLALQGYDPVAYFESNRAARGNPKLNAQHASGTYYFSTDANRELFVKSPEKYVPAYGGWCATAMADGRKVEIDPANYKITNGRLLLFYKSLIANALKDWNKDEAELTKRADENWQNFLADKK